ncbi:hypothetical protein KHA90_25240, partial [Flavobacterium psychroterrae]
SSSALYWQEQFKGSLPVLDLPSFQSRPLMQTYNGDSLSYRFPSALLEKAEAFCAAHDLTLFMFLMAGINGLLSRYTGQEDIILGTP